MTETIDIRERQGRRVREIWVAWAMEQPDPKPSWLVPWDELGEADKEVDRRIGAALWGDGFAEGIDAWPRATVAATERDKSWVVADRTWAYDSPETPDCPNTSTCRNCGQPIVWIDWSYVHPHSGEMDCRPLSLGKSAEPVEWDGRKGDETDG